MTVDANVVVTSVLAKKLTRLRLRILPRASLREKLYLQIFRPLLVRLLFNPVPKAGRSNKIVVSSALAKRLIAFRQKVAPRHSKREIIYIRFVRPLLVRFLLRPGAVPEPIEYEHELIDETPGDVSVVSLRSCARRLEDVREILIIKADHIGDFFLALQAFDILKRAFSKAKFTLLCGSWNKDVAEASGFFDRVVCVNIFPEVSGQDMKQTAFDPSPIIAANLPQFDIAIDLKVEDDTRFLIDHVEANFKAGFHAANLPRGINFLLPVPAMKLYGQPNEARHTRALLSMLASGVVDLFDAQRETIQALEGVRAAAPSLPPFARSRGPVIGINVGSGAPTRNWPVERYEILAKDLIEKHDATVVLMGSRQQQAENARIAKTVSHHNLVDLAGQISLVQFSALLNELDVYIGHDTGGTHLAASLGGKTICLHSGVTPLESFGPIGEKVTVIKTLNLPCSPCGLKDLAKCQYEHRCMKMITTQDVMKEVEYAVSLTNR